MATEHVDTAVVNRRTEPAPLYAPTGETISGSRLTEFIRFCETRTGRDIGTSDRLYEWSIADRELFWTLFLEFSGLVWEGDLSPACTSGEVETAQFFPYVRLNYAENLLSSSVADPAAPAVTSRGLEGVRERLTRGELLQRVRRYAAALVAMGIGFGDRVVSVVRNDAGSVVAALASATVGAIFSSAAPEMGVPSLLGRFGQLAPSLLIVSTLDAPGFEGERLRQLAEGLPSLKAISVLDASTSALEFPVRVLNSSTHDELGPISDGWNRYPFNHPLYILFSSGTTGAPKCIVHGAGGTLLEHTKEHQLHGNLRAGDKLFFHTSTAWMMWNWLVSALACGVEIVLYDGPVVEPDVLWRLVAEERVAAFGTSPPYIRMCQTAGYQPAVDLSALRCIMSTGTILYDEQFEWLARNAGDVPVQSISGGTDIVGCFVLGNPNLPVYAGEAQCRGFGLDVRAWNPKCDDKVGELVCAQPFPSRPLGLYGDTTGERFHKSYFSQNPGVWTHGDLIEITPRGTARMHGRSDGTMNVRGIRIGPAEVYRVLSTFPEIQEAMAVEQPTPGGEGDLRMVLLVVLNHGHELDSQLRARIRTSLARDATPAHVPAVIVDVPELPLTHSGKRSEVAARNALKGERPSNLAALRNPGSLDVIADRVNAWDARAASFELVGARTGCVEDELKAIWERVLGVSPIGPDDDFFESGGTSLLTAPLFQQIADRLGRRLPLSTILSAPTISLLAALLRDDPGERWPVLVMLKPGAIQRPLFFAPPLTGEILGLLPVAVRIDTDRAVYGLRGRGLVEGEQPLDTIEKMAEVHCQDVRLMQPHGPYALIGYSLGGQIAFEMARRFTADGEEVEFLGLIDTISPWASLTVRERLVAASRLPARWPRVARLECQRAVARVRERFGPQDSSEGYRRMMGVQRAGACALKTYRPRSLDVRGVFYQASHLRAFQADPTVLWSRLVRRGLRVEPISGYHDALMHDPHVGVLAAAISRSLPSEARWTTTSGSAARSKRAGTLLEKAG